MQPSVNINNMNDAGRQKVWDALLYGNHAGELAIGITPTNTWIEPDQQHEVVEVLARTNNGRGTTPAVVSALAHAGLLHIDAERSAGLASGDTPQLELLLEVEDDQIMSGDKRLFFVDRAAKPAQQQLQPAEVLV
jgi:hypothetical protein